MRMSRIQSRFFCSVILILAGLSTVSAQWSVDEEAGYIKRFKQQFTTEASVPALNEYASPANYDLRYLGEALDADLNRLPEDGSGFAWGWSYRMMSLNEMFRATGDRKYLRANHKSVMSILNRRDDKRQIKLWTGECAPVWSSGKYAERGRSVFAVHTGIITYPMLDFVSLARNDSSGGLSMKDDLKTIVQSVRQSLDFHDRQWRDGPEKGEGHYVGLNQEKVMEGKPLPGNR